MLFLVLKQSILCLFFFSPRWIDIFKQNTSEGDEKPTDEVDNVIERMSEEAIENYSEDMMQVNLEALQNQSSGDDATDANNQVSPIDNQINLQTADVIEMNSDSSSLPAIAEDLPNGNSQDTRVGNELDAEMVSEDELPAPAQPKIDDAEDLSDEELPGPKRAELPADTEVVSEDEFPSSNKVKRKIDDIQEADNANENTETPKKRAKAENDGKFHLISMTPFQFWR